MDRHFVIAVDRTWAVAPKGNAKRIEQHLFPIGPEAGGLGEKTQIILRFRRPKAQVQVEEISIMRLKDGLYLRSKALCEWCLALPDLTTTLLFFFEGSPSTVRCVVVASPPELWDTMTTLDPPLRPAAFDLPPTAAAVVDAEEIYTAVHGLVAGGDSELFGAHVQAFLAAPHIVVPLFAHVLSLSSQDNIDFPLILRTTAERMRSFLTDTQLGAPRIKKIERNHAKLWAEVLGERIAFVDGGVARIAGVPSIEPLAIRVGIYSVIPGESDISKREDWRLSPFVMGDIVRRVISTDEPPDPKRLQEASRYVLEPLTALQYLERVPDVSALFLHGPLVNQFTQYDEGEPSFLPVLAPEFLARFGFTEMSVSSLLTGIPSTPLRVPLWNQFMAVYGALVKRMFASTVPIVGVVERTAGRWLTHATLRLMVSEHRMTEALSKRIMDLVDRFQISDDFLFGCILEEGEYLEPTVVMKNPERRARPHWQEVVRQYPNPHTTILKTSESNFPYRVEMNPAGLADSARLLRLLYHTSRLLPEYAFPVGLDIVDKYAKVPDWLSRGISARITADVLRRALNTGDPRIVAQVRQFLARTPRDFFYRPQA